MKTKQKKVALFGGSFNPIHNQHIKIISKLFKGKIVDEVWIIPCKKHAFNKDYAPIIHRLKMIKLGLKNLKNAKICKVELKSRTTNYTIKTIKKLKEKYPHRFFWIIGSDILYEVHKWKNYQELFNQIEFIIFKRKKYPIKKIKNMKIYKQISCNVNNISSTEIRKQAKDGKSLKSLVPQIIEKYIKNKGLYEN